MEERSYTVIPVSNERGATFATKSSLVVKLSDIPGHRYFLTVDFHVYAVIGTWNSGSDYVQRVAMDFVAYPENTLHLLGEL